MKKKTTVAKSATGTVKRATTPSADVMGHAPVQDIQVRIATRAHELYVQRGCLDGFHLHDWLAAEHEILGQAHGSDKPAARI